MHCTINSGIDGGMDGLHYPCIISSRDGGVNGVSNWCINGIISMSMWALSSAGMYHTTAGYQYRINET